MGERLFDDVVLKEGFGCDRDILQQLQQAASENRRIQIMYLRPGESKPQIHELDPYHLFFRRRALYLEGHSCTEKGIRMYRLNRIKSVTPTHMLFTVRDDYDFGLRHRNAFSAFPGNETQQVKIRFTRKIRPFIEESLWHHSQHTETETKGSLIFEVHVAEPREVMWWSFFWGAGAEILEPEWLRKEAKVEIKKMAQRYNENNSE